MLRWCVVQTKPREEAKAISHLENQEFRTFMPLLREHRGRETRTVPMFPRYLFVEIDTEERKWLSINGTRGVQRVMALTIEMPSLLPVGFVEHLLETRSVADWFFDALAFKKGDMVELTEGPFKGQQGVCQWTSEKRVSLLLNMLGRETLVSVEAHVVKPIKKT